MVRWIGVRCWIQIGFSLAPFLNGSIINWTDDKIHQSNFYVFE